jgi:hypothetical protein
MDIHSAFGAWDSFYVIIGSSAAALTGLQFVVIALVADSEARSGSGEIAAFGTPTIVHFCVALLVAAAMSTPWPLAVAAAGAIGASGLFGVVYTLIVARRAARTTEYKPVVEDWIWHIVLPLCSYVALVVAALDLPSHAVDALFAVAGASVLLVFIGIHNAWDTVTYIALDLRKPAAAPGPPQPPADPANAASTRRAPVSS